MTDLRSDSPICRRVVRAFLDFLDSVQPAPGVDLEGLNVARECLEEVFKLDSFSSDDEMSPGMLVNLFSSLQNGAQCKDNSQLGPLMRESTSCTTSCSQQLEDSSDFRASQIEDQVADHNVLGVDVKDELFGKFFAALDKLNFFKTSPDGVDDPAQVAQATKFFNDSFMELENFEGQTIDHSRLGDKFKVRGNQSMQSKAYSEAIGLYTCAIALCERNAVYYCNRAAAFTQINRYTEAIEDCLKSIEINPSYSKAYSRLGLAYYAQGNYSDALHKGFLKALQLDPHNDSVRDNIRVAQQKLMEQHQRANASQNIGSNNRQRSSTQPGGSTNGGIRFAAFSADALSPPEYTADFGSAWSVGGNDSHTFSFSAATPPIPPAPEFPDMFRTGTSAGSAPQTNPFASFSSAPEFANVYSAAANAAASTPVNLAEVLRTMAPAAHGQQTQSRPSNASEGPDQAEVRADQNTSFNFAEAPEQISDVLRSVMGMFASQQGSQQDTHRGGN